MELFIGAGAMRRVELETGLSLMDMAEDGGKRFASISLIHAFVKHGYFKRLTDDEADRLIEDYLKVEGNSLETLVVVITNGLQAGGFFAQGPETPKDSPRGKTK